MSSFAKKVGEGLSPPPPRFDAHVLSICSKLNKIRSHKVHFFEQNGNSISFHIFYPDLSLPREPSLWLVNGYFECSLSNLPPYLYDTIQRAEQYSRLTEKSLFN